MRHRCEIRNVPGDLLQIFDQIKSVALYPRGATLFRKADQSRGVFVLCQGSVKTSIFSTQQQKKLLRIVGAGEMLGLSATLSGMSYEVTAQTIDAVQVAFIERNALLAFLRKYPAVTLSVIHLLGRDLQSAYDRVRRV